METIPYAQGKCSGSTKESRRSHRDCPGKRRSLCGSCEYTYIICRCDLIVLTIQDKALNLPKEHEMHSRDKYTVYSATTRGYRKGIHKVPKWTRVRTLLSQISTPNLVS